MPTKAVVTATTTTPNDWAQIANASRAAHHFTSFELNWIITIASAVAAAANLKKRFPAETE